MPKTRRVDVWSAPNTLTSKSDAASATFGCSRNSGVVASEIPRRTTRVTLSRDPNTPWRAQERSTRRGESRAVRLRRSTQLRYVPRTWGLPAPLAAYRSKRAASQPAPLQHRRRAELVGGASLCPGPSAVVRHWREFLASDGLGQTLCLILDIAMPGMTGPDLQRELTRRGVEIPIVFITAHRDDTVRTRMLEHGAVECLFKPFSESALVEALEAALMR
jgi:CheY-like chemotaxis protein